MSDVSQGVRDEAGQALHSQGASMAGGPLAVNSSPEAGSSQEAEVAGCELAICALCPRRTANIAISRSTNSLKVRPTSTTGEARPVAPRSAPSCTSRSQTWLSVRCGRRAEFRAAAIHADPRVQVSIDRSNTSRGIGPLRSPRSWNCRISNFAPRLARARSRSLSQVNLPIM